MAKEIELKLGLPASHARRVTAHPLLGGYKPQRYRLFNTYYDTPEFDLRNRGIALRLRRKGWSTWLMTVKGGASGAGGLAQRSEWEAPTQPGVFDFNIAFHQCFAEGFSFLCINDGAFWAKLRVWQNDNLWHGNLCS